MELEGTSVMGYMHQLRSGYDERIIAFSLKVLSRCKMRTLLMSIDHTTELANLPVVIWRDQCG